MRFNEYPAADAVIVAQAIRKPQTVARSYCVSWWSDGTVTEQVFDNREGSTRVDVSQPRLLPRGTVWNDADFYAEVRPGEDNVVLADRARRNAISGEGDER